MMIGGWLVYEEWRTVLGGGPYVLKAVLFGPLGVFVGLGLLLFPFDYDRLLDEHGVDRVQHFRHLTPEWKIWSLLTLAAAFANWYAIEQWR